MISVMAILYWKQAMSLNKLFYLTCIRWWCLGLLTKKLGQMFV